MAFADPQHTHVQNFSEIEQTAAEYWHLRLKIWADPQLRFKAGRYQSPHNLCRPIAHKHPKFQLNPTIHGRITAT